MSFLKHLHKNSKLLSLTGKKYFQGATPLKTTALHSKLTQHFNSESEKIHCHEQLYEDKRFVVAAPSSDVANTKTKFNEGTISDNLQGKIGGEFNKISSNKAIDERATYFDQIYAEQQAILASTEKFEITVTLKDGKQIKGSAFETTPSGIAKQIFKKIPEKFIAAKVSYSKKYKSELNKIGDLVNAEVEEHEQHQEGCSCGSDKEKYEIIDLDRPLEGDCTFELIDFESPEGREVFWHSSAHILGESLELNYGSQLCSGPPLLNGFFYDSFMGEQKISHDNFAEIEKTFSKLASEKQPFQRVVLTKQQALELFKSNPFKVQLIQHKIPEGSITTAYKCGKLIDLCTGPHLPHTGYVKAFKVQKNSAAYWLGNNQNDHLQRVYGISFPSKKEMDAHVKRLEELAKRDHRNIGKQQELFTFHQYSPGCAFFYPNGAHIYNKLMECLRRQYRIRGYSEVITPNLFHAQLWKISGHWDKYQEHMFLLQNDNEEHGFKPMNCPAHCLMFDSIQRSYRDLPIRYADFGVLHRNEIHGALSGLTRVRRFQQDDAHIFCTMDQIMDEIKKALEFVDYMYSLFGFKYSLALSTRPDNYLGEKEIWDQAENSLKVALQEFGKPWTIKAKDGAFYGPKIDIQLFDAFDRGHQCGTIQLDFNLPVRFNLQYRGPDTKEELNLTNKKEDSNSKQEQQLQNSAHKSTSSCSHNHESEKKQGSPTLHSLKQGFQRPVILHRAVVGSLERFFAILCEQTAGKWPFWLSPRQLMICPVTNKFNSFAQALTDRLNLEGYQVKVDLSEGTLNKKVRNAQVDQFNYIAVVGEEEVNGGYVDLRERDNQERLGKFTINELIALFKTQEPKKSQAELDLWNNLGSVTTTVNQKFLVLEDELKTKMFFEGDGTMQGQRDKEIFEQLKGSHIDSVDFPHLIKWLKHVYKQ